MTKATKGNVDDLAMPAVRLIESAGCQTLPVYFSKALYSVKHKHNTSTPVINFLTPVIFRTEFLQKIASRRDGWG
jgi:hypothetical protein